MIVRGGRRGGFLDALASTCFGELMNRLHSCCSPANQVFAQRYKHRLAGGVHLCLCNFTMCWMSWSCLTHSCASRSGVAYQFPIAVPTIEHRSLARRPLRFLPKNMTGLEGNVKATKYREPEREHGPQCLVQRYYPGGRIVRLSFRM